jgi:hypothetical protein
MPPPSFLTLWVVLAVNSGGGMASRSWGGSGTRVRSPPESPKGVTREGKSCRGMNCIHVVQGTVHVVLSAFGKQNKGWISICELSHRMVFV